MSLDVYLDSGATTMVSSANPDTARKAGIVNSDIVDERKVYLYSNDSQYTYEDIEMDAFGDEDAASSSGQTDIEYALDNNGSPGTYSDILNIPNGDFTTPYPVWRKATAPNISHAFNRVDIIYELIYKKYKK